MNMSTQAHLVARARDIGNELKSTYGPLCLNSGQLGETRLILYSPDTVETRYFLKCCNVTDRRDPARRERLARERLGTSGISAVIDQIEMHGYHIIVMPYETGRDLSSFEITQEGIEKVFRDSGDILLGAHAQGIIHRDFKPTNVRVPIRGSVKVNDWELAHFPDIPYCFKENMVEGTPGFVAPELMTTCQEGTPMTDQYAYAASAYYLLTGIRAGSTDENTTYSQILANTACGSIFTIEKSKAPPIAAKTIMQGMSMMPTERTTIPEVADAFEFAVQTLRNQGVKQPTTSRASASRA